MAEVQYLTNQAVKLFIINHLVIFQLKMAPYCTDGWQTSDGMAALVGFWQLGLSFLLGHFADASPMIGTNDAVHR